LKFSVISELGFVRLLYIVHGIVFCPAYIRMSFACFSALMLLIQHTAQKVH